MKKFLKKYWVVLLVIAIPVIALAGFAGDAARTFGMTQTGSTTNFLGNVAITGTLAGQDEVRVLNFEFFDVDVAASQSAAEWGMDANSDAGGSNFKRVTVPVTGSVIGITIFSNAACTSGTVTADATINGSVTGFQVALDSVSNATSNQTTQANDVDTITAGDEIGVKITTTSSYTPTSADIVVSVFVEY